MRIGFDLRPFLKEETGVGVYFRNLLLSLSQIDKDNTYFLFSASLKDRFPSSKIPPFSERHFVDTPLPVKLMNFLWNKLAWPPLDYFFGQSLDLTHSPSPLILPTRGKKVVTVHDLFFAEFPQQVDRKTRRYFSRRVDHSLLRADGIIAVSRFTRNQLLRRLTLDEEKVQVIYHGLNPRFQSKVSEEEIGETREKHSLPSDFILFVGGLEPRKNLIRLIQALQIIHTRHGKIPLVIVGPRGILQEKLERKIQEQRLRSWVRVTGYLPVEELRVLYRLATVFAFPSLCEGFGLPLLEAMASDLPIAASQASAIPEVAQDAALYFHPEDPESIAEKIILILEDESLRQSLIAKGKRRVLDFDWNVSAAETLRFYQTVVKN
jgi:glycosyltransferase involved in cell wall biosynthesis